MHSTSIPYKMRIHISDSPHSLGTGTGTGNGMHSNVLHWMRCCRVAFDFQPFWSFHVWYWKWKWSECIMIDCVRFIISRISRILEGSPQEDGDVNVLLNIRLKRSKWYFRLRPPNSLKSAWKWDSERLPNVKQYRNTWCDIYESLKAHKLDTFHVWLWDSSPESCKLGVYQFMAVDYCARKKCHHNRKKHSCLETNRPSLLYDDLNLINYQIVDIKCHSHSAFLNLNIISQNYIYLIHL